MHSENKQEIVEVVTKDPELLAEVINTDAAQTIIVQQAMSLHHGPLPPAREMAEYAKHIPKLWRQSDDLCRTGKK
ncbi:putative inner membrane protein [Glaesserella parasuis ZJ0906]|uniref:Putative inner membrane protein n=1 Tax=Glaesserella parasuis ZJ0906 TaxID=1322346 RepID=A0A806J1L9_GLAPU|nr:putative inner membrane protein [Glaesserella parasuis ZJ0906]